MKVLIFIATRQCVQHMARSIDRGNRPVLFQRKTHIVRSAQSGTFYFQSILSIGEKLSKAFGTSYITRLKKHCLVLVANSVGRVVYTDYM